MRKRLALLALGLSALAQEVAVYPGFAEVKEPVDLPAAWVYLAGEKLGRILPGSLRLLGVEETERVFQGSAVLFRYRGRGRRRSATSTRGFPGRSSTPWTEPPSPPGPASSWKGRP